MTNNQAFARKMEAHFRRAEKKIETLVKEFAINVTIKLVDRSPVRTGRFRSNWNAGIGSLDKTTTLSTQNNAVDRAKLVIGNFKIGDKAVFVSNSLDYAGKLEYGWSKQAPNGMVRITALESSQIMRKTVAGLK